MHDTTTLPLVELLLVEDNPGDIELTREAIDEAKIRNRLHVVTDGEEAMSFLHQEGEYASSPRPDLVLLDLNLPCKDGREVLHEIKDDPALRDIPVVILTTSEDENDILGAYKDHANCYITKPVDLDRFVEVVRSIEDFWIGIVKLPQRFAHELALSSQPRPIESSASPDGNE